jgi:coenzyme Q-binding protein COQ10
MPKATYAKRIFHSADDLIAMVADVENYPKFVDLITALRITKETQVSDEHTRFEAEAVVAYKMINETFASTVDVHRDSQKIIVQKSERGGPLKSLLNEWTFHPLSDGSTLVEFFIDVRLKAFFLDNLLAQKFDKAANMIMTAFEARAGQLYEPSGDPDHDAGDDIHNLDLSHSVQMA